MGFSFYAVKTNSDWKSHGMFRRDVTPAALCNRFMAGTFAPLNAYRSGLSTICIDQVDIEPPCLPDTVAIITVSGRKPADPVQAPDIWTAPSGHHIVSEKARAFIEAHDPEYSGFYPVRLVHAKSGAPFGTRTYFYWVIRRFIKLDVKQPELPADWDVVPDVIAPWKAVPLGMQSQIFHALARDRAAQDYLSGIAFWTIWPSNDLYMSEAVYNAALAAGLTGLNLSTDRAPRHVTRYVLPNLQ